MSLLADFYLSRDDQAIRYDSTPDQFADRAQYKRITPLELSALWSIMRGAEWDVAVMDSFPCLHQVDEGERLIHQLPSDMVADLATLSSEQPTAITSTWAATEELSCAPEDIRPVVDDLVRLARRAIETSQNIYLWNCI